jgi:hypothetical protein
MAMDVFQTIILGTKEGCPEQEPPELAAILARPAAGGGARQQPTPDSVRF